MVSGLKASQGLWLFFWGLFGVLGLEGLPKGLGRLALGS